MNPITPEEALERMQAIYPLSGIYDNEEAHSKADDLLCEILESLGYGKTVELFKSSEKWYA